MAREKDVRLAAGLRDDLLIVGLYAAAFTDKWGGESHEAPC
ncbi:hypothetical protein NITLEN_30374 [Nitrospira lenta]|uniref:Uncharacterized protein n=1 Tax=Nitrospira lenta TaxID=1436998 RepID=A0A330LEP7_9BACT|nr:hypothetical protein NITLEN_30374 [Nitrospira lenta]